MLVVSVDLGYGWEYLFGIIIDEQEWDFGSTGTTDKRRADRLDKERADLFCNIVENNQWGTRWVYCGEGSLPLSDFDPRVAYRLEQV